MINFIKEHKIISSINLFILVFITVFILTNRKPECFLFGKEIMDILLNIGLAIIASTIFYIFQVYIPSIKVKKIAQIEIQTMYNRIISMFGDILASSLKKGEINNWRKEKKLSNFLSKKTASQISENFNLETYANHSPKMLYLYYLPNQVDYIRDRCDMIASKYSHSLDIKSLIFLHELNRSPLVEYMRILNNREYLDFCKKYHGKISLPQNFLEELFVLLKNFSSQLEISDSVSIQEGLAEKSIFKE